VNWDKVMKQFLKVHLQREKKKQQLAEKREKDRILALKNDDEVFLLTSFPLFDLFINAL